MTAQHRLLCRVIRMRKAPSVKRVVERKVRVWKLKGKAELRFLIKVDEYKPNKGKDGEVNECWKSIKSAVQSATEEICGITKRNKQQEKEIWWWNEVVKKRKKEVKKEEITF